MNSIKKVIEPSLLNPHAQIGKVPHDHSKLPNLIAKWGEDYAKYLTYVQRNIEENKFLTELVFSSDNAEAPVGFFAYERCTSNRYDHYGIKDSLSVRALLLDDVEKLSSVVKRIYTIAEQLGAQHVHVLVSQKDRVYAPLISKYLQISTRASDKGIDLLYARVSALKTLFFPAETTINRDNRPPIVAQASTASVNRKRDRNTYEDNRIYQQSNKKRKIVVESKPRVQQREVTLKRMYIQMIQQGTKTWEGRIYSGMFQHFCVNDEVRFFYQQNPRDDVVCTVKQVKVYKTFQEMLQDGGVQRYLPDMKDEDVDGAVKIYHGIPGYQQRAHQNGVVGIKLEKKVV